MADEAIPAAGNGQNSEGASEQISLSLASAEAEAGNSILPPAAAPAVPKTPAAAERPTPDAQEMADRLAVLFIDVGEPGSEAEISGFLKKACEDKRVYNSPLGDFGRALFTAIPKCLAAGEFRRALASVGGSFDLESRLSAKADEVCAALSAMGGLPPASPFAATLFGRTSITQAMDEIRKEGFTQVAAIWPRPFESALVSSITDALLLDAERHPESPAFVLVQNWLDEAALAEAMAESVSKAASSLSAQPAGAPQPHVAFVLRALPIQGSLDPALVKAQKLARLAMEKTGLKLEHSVIYLDGMAPHASLHPDLDDLFQRFPKPKPALILVPLMSLCGDLALTGYLTGDGERRAAKYKYPPLTIAQPPLDKPFAVPMLAKSVLDHLTRAVEFSQSSYVSPNWKPPKRES